MSVFLLVQYSNMHFSIFFLFFCGMKVHWLPTNYQKFVVNFLVSSSGPRFMHITSEEHKSMPHCNIYIGCRYVCWFSKKRDI